MPWQSKIWTTLALVSISGGMYHIAGLGEALLIFGLMSMFIAVFGIWESYKKTFDEMDKQWGESSRK